MGDHEKIVEFRTGDTITLGRNIAVRPVHLDHSVPGAYGFIVETPDGALVYSGDLRFHETASRLSWDFVKEAVRARPKVLILEGTRVNSSRRDSEETVFKSCAEKVKSCSGLVVVGLYPKDLDRLYTFYRIARENGRKLAIPLKTACVIDALKDDPHLSLARQMWEDKEHFLVHFHRVRSGKFLEVDYPACMFKEDKARGWTRPCLLERRVSATEIGQAQNKFLWVLDFYHLTELVEARPNPGSIYIYSMSELKEDPIEELEAEILENWCQRFNLQKINSHASGHASREELREMIETVNPRYLVPIHTEHPEEFRELFSRVIIPEKGKTINF